METLYNHKARDIAADSIKNRDNRDESLVNVLS